MESVRILTGFLVASALLAGCKDGGQEKRAAGAFAVRAENDEQARGHHPYYYGLIEEYRTVLAEDPHNLAAMVALGNAYYESAQWKEAARYYEQALALDPHNTDVITDLGTCYRNLGMPDRALAEYQRALALESAHQNAMYNTGVVHAFDRKDYKAAILAWEHLLRLAPMHPKADFMRSNIVKFKNILKEAQ